ncbi:hypothetical protein chiPu_0012447 [Chiloscyllium punctatum]|uniref:Uncharacterized protein n=1 Tax=Chiloscyllium punctatum TaxID=137246 RepID=A0A401SU90_CHIPU|nr:hypothetical protein [Chiloscyllium punctatum]
MSKVAERGRQEQLGTETLVCAMQQGQRRLARFVLEALDGRIVNRKLEQGRTPLILAALLPEVKQSVRFVKLLLARKAAVNCQDAQGRTSLSYACQSGNIEVVKLLVQSNADPEIADNWGNSALIYGAFAGHSLVVDFLVRSFKRLGLDVTRTNLAGNSAISIALDLGHHDCVRILTSQARKQSAGSEGTAGPLEDITFKRSPHGQNQPSTEEGGRVRGWELPRVAGARAQQGHNLPRGKWRDQKHPPQVVGPLESLPGCARNAPPSPDPCPRSIGLPSVADRAHGAHCSFVQLIETPATGDPGRAGRARQLLLPCIGVGGQINAGCDRSPESPRFWVNENCSPHSVSHRRGQGAGPSCCKGIKEGHLGDCCRHLEGLEPPDGDAEDQPLSRKQDSDTPLPGSQVLPPHQIWGQSKAPRCLCSPSHRDVPAVGKQGVTVPFSPQGDGKHVENATSSSSNLQSEHPVTVGRGMGPMQRNIGSEMAVTSPNLAPPCPDTHTVPVPTFPRGLESMLSEICVPGGEVLGQVVCLSDCELEEQPFFDTHGQRRFLFPHHPCRPRARPRIPLCHPSTASCKSSTSCRLRGLFRRFTAPQLKAGTEDREALGGCTLGAGKTLCCSETFPQHLSRSRGKPAAA